MLSSPRSPEPEEIITAFKLGADDLLIYPFDGTKLAECIQQIKSPRTGWLYSVKLFCKKWLLPTWLFLKKKTATPLEPLPHNDTANRAPQLSSATSSIIAPGFEQLITPEDTNAGININLFGKFEIFANGKALKIPAKKERSLLAYMLFHHDKYLNRDKLMAKFWPHSTTTAARNCLNVTIHKVRKLLKDIYDAEEVIIYQDECYSINPDLEFKLDVTEFLHCWEKGRYSQSTDQGQTVALFQKAVDLYNGDFMEHMLYEDWADSERDKLKEAYLYMLNTLCQYYFKQKQTDTTIRLAKRMLEKDNCLEEVHRLLMKCYLRQNKNGKAIRQFNKCRDVLKKELGVSPSEATINLLKQINQMPERL